MSSNLPNRDENRRITALDIHRLGRGWSRFWLRTWLLTVLLAIVGAWHLTNTLSQRRQVIVMDPSRTYYLAESEDLHHSNAFHSAQAILAMEALFDRHPKGPDHPHRLELLFTKGALRKARQHLEAEAEEFRSKELHSKVEVGPIELLRVRDASLLIATEGQLIRNGVFQDRPITEVLEVKVQFQFVRNPHMLTNGRFPTLVSDFNISTKLASQS